MELWTGSFLKIRFPEKTVEAFVCPLQAGYFAGELEELLHVSVHKPLRELALTGKLRREQLPRGFLYVSPVKNRIAAPQS
ncbi:hypothetical protein GWN42_14070 [candidate division KSB1 bacterium]|nr:hypothetical protein [candidate division KSB1 bacterium]